MGKTHDDGQGLQPFQIRVFFWFRRSKRTPCEVEGAMGETVPETHVLYIANNKYCLECYS